MGRAKRKERAEGSCEKNGKMRGFGIKDEED